MHLSCLSRWQGTCMLVLLCSLPLNAIAYGINHENISAQNIKRSGIPAASKAPAAAAAASAASAAPALATSSTTARTTTRPAVCKAKTTTSAAVATTTAPPKPSCYMQNEDPDQGINERGCICGTLTLPLLSIPAESVTRVDQSCSYTALPSSSVSNPISIETQTYTSGCHICTLVGGYADIPDCSQLIKGCTPPPPPPPASTTTSAGKPGSTFAVFISNNTVPVGIEDNLNNGTDLRNTMYSQLHAFCPDSGPSCNSVPDAHIDNIPTIIDGGDEYETLKFTIQDSNYTSTLNRDKMLAAAVSTWQQAVSRNCKEVEYEAEADPTIDGCGQGPVSWTRAVHKRTPRPIGPGDTGPPTRTCTYAANLCSGPDHITVVLGTPSNPYENHLNIQVAYTLGDPSLIEFICEAVADGLAEVAMAVAPELFTADTLEEIDFEATCAELADTLST